MQKRALSFVLALAVLTMTAILVVMPSAAQTSAQQTVTPTLTATPNPEANISFPPPVYVVRGEFDIRGTANLPDQTNYFIEFRPLDGDLLGATGQAIFFPAILPSTDVIVDDILGTWDTTLVPDGIYELRLTVNVTGEDPVTQIVGPIRVENNPPPFAVIEPLIPATAVPAEPTAVPPTAEPTEDPTPIGTVSTLTANVRAGDNTQYAVIASLPQNTTVQLVGISNRGTNWYQVRLPSGQLGWMAPSVITVSGNVAGLPLVSPPPLPPTAIPPTLTFTPLPIFTATPATTANYVAGNLFLNPGQPTCNQQFTVTFDVANLGTVVAPGGSVRFTDARASDNALPTSQTITFPAINPGQTINVTANFTVGVFFNEVHRFTAAIDPDNLFIEAVEGDNVRTADYTLQQGSCG